MKIENKNEKTYNLICFLFIFFSGMIVIRMCNGEQKQYYDSWAYWEYGKGFFSGEINLFRGVYFPGLLGLFAKLGDKAGIFWNIFSMLCISWFYIYCYSKIFTVDNNAKSVIGKIFQKVVPWLIFLFLFWGLIAYTLSDLWAFVVASIATMLCIELCHKLKTSNYLSVFFKSFIMGGFVYIAYNIRTIYEFFGIGLVVYMIVYSIHQGKKTNLFKWSGSILGFVIAAIPQLIMNIKYMSQYNIKVPTNSLFTSQLLWGLKYQRYDTYVGNAVENPGMTFMDAVGKRIISVEGLENAFSIKKYIMLIIKYPFEMVGIYVRHFVNMLMPIWPSQYIKNMNNNKILYVILAYTIVFASFLVMCIGTIIDKQRLISSLLLIIPVLVITPGAVESRFYMPLFLVMIGTLCYNTDYEKTKEVIKKHKLKLIFLYMLIFILLISIWTSCLASYSYENNIFFE